MLPPPSPTAFRPPTRPFPPPQVTLLRMGSFPPALSTLLQVVAETGITYISVGHRPTLRAFHGQLLQLRPGGSDGGAVSWEVQMLPGRSAVAAAAATA